MNAPVPNGELRPASGPADNAPAKMMGMITAYRISQVVRCAAMFSLAEHCQSGGTITADSISESERIHPDATARLLRACAALGLLQCDDGRHFRATPLLNTLVRDVKGSLWGFAVSLPAPGHWLPWGHLPEAVRTGEASSTHISDTLFDYFDAHREEQSAFMEGLAGMTAVAGAEASRVIDTTNTQQAIDIGGASGTLLHDLMRLNPQLRGIVFDVPVVAEQAADVARTLGFGNRLATVGGDFFISVPSGADMYLLRYVLHDWDDKACVQILRNCRDAMREGAKIYVLEMVLGVIGSEDAIVPLQDLNMLAILRGRERSMDDFDRLFDLAGLKRTAAMPTNSPLWVIEAQAK